MPAKIKNHAIDALEQKHFFKLVCGASLTDTQLIENLSFIFTLAGAHVIDLAPTADVIFAARRGVERVGTSRDLPLLMASIQLDKDPHFRKINVDYNLCDVCGACVKVCPTGAFVIASPRNDKLSYKIELCYGCNICPSYCHVNALTLVETKPTPKETLKEMINLGIKAIEFHFGKNYKKIEDMWHEIKDLVNNLDLVSFSIGSELLSDNEIKEAARLCYKLAGKGIILQCDGKPMSGGLKNGNNTDNQSLEVARIIQKEKLPVFLQISGGTNQYSFRKALQAGLDINGVAIGSFARKLLMPYLSDLNNKTTLNKAIDIAESLVNYN